MKLFSNPMSRWQILALRALSFAGKLGAISISLGIFSLYTPQQVLAQITKEAGTNTNVNSNGNTINITGGQLSGDNQNLFHSFQQFGVNSGQTANFIPPNANISNILGRVMGGNPSVINGVIQIQPGFGTPNLYLMNPAGMIFGASASLNVPASFTATTATSIGFGNNWFNASGVNDYPALVGNPNAFAFNVNQPGAIINAANLSGNGGDLTLLGGTVVSTGELKTAGGRITIAAVQGTSFVRLSAPGNVLSLEVEPIATANTQPGNWAFPVQSLPQLLTGSGAGNATGLTVNSQGQVVLTGSGMQVDSNTGSVTIAGARTLKAGKDLRLQAQGNLGNITIQNIQIEVEQDLILKAPQGNIRVENSQLQTTPYFSDGRDIQLTGQSITIEQSQLRSPKNIQLVASNTVEVSDGKNPSIIRTGGNLTVQGNQAVNIDALNRPQSAFRAGGNLTLISDGNINGNGRFINNGNFSVLNLSGGMGNLRYNASGSNGIISSAGDVNFGNYEGVSLKVEAGGSITGGDITITGPNTALQGGTDSDIVILSNDPAVILRAGLTELKNTPNVLPSLTELRNSPTVPPNLTLGETTFTATGASSSPGNITVGNINTSLQNSGGGPVILSATGNIKTGAIRTGGDSSVSEDTFGGFVNLSARGNIKVKTIGTFGGDGGDITIAAGGLFRATGTFLSTDANFNPTDDDITTGTDGRISVPARDVPTSINATGGNFGGSTISIRHGGRSFIVGPSFVTDADGDIVFVDKNRNPVSYKDSNGNIATDKDARSVVFTDINGNKLDSYGVSPLGQPLSVSDIPADASFTAGAITSNQWNNGIVVSLRDRPLIGNGTFKAGRGDLGNRIIITSSFTPRNNNTDNNGKTTTPSTSSGNPNPVVNNTSGTVVADNTIGNSNDINVDNSANDSNNPQIATQIFEQQDEQEVTITRLCRKPEQTSEKPTNERDRSDEEEKECEKLLKLLQQEDSAPTSLHLEFQLSTDTVEKPDSSNPTTSSLPNLPR